MHIVEKLIAERAAKLRSRKIIWPLIRPALYKSLGYRRAVSMADHIAEMSGHDAFDYVAQEIGIQTKPSGLDYIPAEGPVIIIGNHPTGLADGLFVREALKTRRPDHLFLANADALRVIPRGDDIIIPVEWVKEKRTAAKAKTTLKAMKQAAKAGKAIIIFPSGALANRAGGKMIEKPWMHTAASFALKRGIPIVPLHIEAKNSAFFYFFDKVNQEIKDITLFREMLNKGQTRPRLTFGPVIDPQSLSRSPAQATAEIKARVEALGA